MEATFGANRVPGRVVEMSAAVLIALAIGGAGGYIVKGLPSVERVTVTNPARIAPTVQAVGADAVDRAVARQHPLPTLRDDSHLTISQDATLSARKARQFN